MRHHLSLTIVAAAMSVASATIYAAASGSNTAIISEAPMLTLHGANVALEAAVAEARCRDAGGAIAVVDAGGHLIAFARLDGTFAAGAEVSIGKARTAALFRKPTKAFEDSIKNGRVALVGVDALTPLQGGVPITVGGEIVGAIGVSGAHTQIEDEEIAIFGASAVQSSASSTNAGQ